MRGNFNQHSARWHNSDELLHNNDGDNGNTINSYCGVDEQQQQQQQQQHYQQTLLRPNMEMKSVNSMQSTTTTTTTTTTQHVATGKTITNDANASSSYNNNSKHILSNNNSCCRSDNYIKWNIERPTSGLSDNEKSTHTRNHSTAEACHTLATMPIAAASVAPTEAQFSTRNSIRPQGLDGLSELTTTATHAPANSCKHLPPITAVAGIKIARQSLCAANGASTAEGGNSAVLRDTSKPKTTASNKLQHCGASRCIRRRRRGGRKSRQCKRKRPQHAQFGSTTIHREKEKTKTNTKLKSKTSTANCSTLTSFMLNSAFLALCNATAATALSAMAATLSGDAVGSGSTASDSQLVSANNVWFANSSFTNNNNMNSSSGASNQLPTLTDVTSDVVGFNASDNLTAEEDREYIFDRTDVRIIFITLYSLVFCCCFFGNLLVILVVTLSRRLRSITNFFLANLALADFCVGLFCVMQNLSIYLIDSWVFGEFLCRMYQFVHSLSYTASIFILVVICMERYFAIVHPITCKQILTATRLRLAILTVWVTSAVYSTPKFVFSKTIKNIHTEDGQEEEICVLDRKMFNSKLLDMINFGLLYVIPLLVMTVLYSKIAIALWRSSHGLSHHLVTQHQQQQHQHHQQQQQQQQQDESMSLHNSMYQHHNHNHLHHQQQHHQHLHHQLSYNAHTTQMTSSTPTNNINHQHTHPSHPHPHHHHNHLQHIQSTTNGQQQQAQLPGNELTTNTTVLGVIGMGGGAVTCGVAVSGVGNNMTSGLLSRRQSSKYEKRAVSITESQVSLDSERPIVSACRNGSSNNGTSSCGIGGGGGGSMNSTHKSSFMQHHHNHSSTHPHSHPHPHQRARVAHMSHSSNNVLRARRGVVRMLIIFVLTFALCNLPYHARKMWQYWSRSYRGDSNFNALLTPLTFLVTYFNSGINPLLYAFLSRNFRKGMRELLLCSWKKGKGKSSSNSSMHHKRVALQVTHSLPTDTTHIGNEQL